MPSALLTLYRSLTRHRLYAILNIGGLALGIAVFLVLFLFVRFETGYDRALPGWERIWVVKRSMQFPGSPEMVIPSPPDLLGQIRRDWPEVDGARMLAADVPVQNGMALVTEKVAWVDRDYFSLFPLQAIAGDAAAALSTPDGMAITNRVAETYFGKASPIGRTLTLIVDGKPTPFRIGAVIADPPAASFYRNAIFLALPRSGQASAGPNGLLTTFVRFPNALTASRRGPGFAALARRHPDSSFVGLAPDVLRQSLIPLPSLHLANPRDGIVVGTLGMVGVLALMIAVVNYVNLATASAALRAREVAIRKVVGATRKALVGQFIGEAMATAVAAGLIGLALTELALPMVNVAGGTSLSVAYFGSDSILPPLALLIVGVGIVAGAYPAFVLSRFQPAAVLASVRAPGGQRAGALLRRAMVVIQFAIATALMIGTGVLVAQTRHLKSSDLGFDRAGLIAVPMGDRALDDSQRRAFVANVARLPGVVAQAQSAIAPAGGSFSIGPMHRDGATGPDPTIVHADIARGFFTTYGARLVAGRFLDSQRHPSDAVDPASPRPRSVVLNRRAVGLLGFDDPTNAIGVTISDGDERAATIIGVIGDMRFSSPRDPVEPLAYFEHDRDLFSAVLTVRHLPGAGRAILAAMEADWRRIAPAAPFKALPVDQQLYESFYRADEQRMRLFMIGAVLAVIIGCIGLYGLTAFDTARRLKEIGIRKALGASTAEILRMLIGQFLRPVLIANIIAVPVAYGVTREWLAGFDDRVALSPWLFVAAIMLTAGIAVATIAGEAWRLARSEPARALRYE